MVSGQRRWTWWRPGTTARVYVSRLTTNAVRDALAQAGVAAQADVTDGERGATNDLARLSDALRRTAPVVTAVGMTEGVGIERFGQIVKRFLLI